MKAPPWKTPLNLVAAWLGRRESALLLLLIVQLGVALGLMSAWQAQAPRSAGATRGTEATACGPIEVAFAPGADMGSLGRWLANFNASIVQGPNERGGFELRVPGQSPESVRASLGPLAESVQPNPLCPARP